MKTSSAFFPLADLTPWEGNVRKTNSEHGLDELASSIEAHGLLSSLVVAREEETGHMVVIAGKRRLAALNKLAEEGKIANDFIVSCQLAEGNPAELSLAENTVREQMHPADEFEAFRDLIDAGETIPAVAERFGIEQRVVQKRLKLARVSPAVIEAFREGDLNLEQVMAFSISNDGPRQDRVLQGLRDHNNDPSDIREALTEGELTAADTTVKFVGIEAYEAAGGATRRDLFCTDDEGVFIQDAELLQRLKAEKLEAAKRDLMAEGWGWVKIIETFTYNEQSKYPQRLEGWYTGKFKVLEKKHAGAIVSIDSYRGVLEVTKGLQTKEDVKNLAAAQKQKAKGKDAGAAPADQQEEEPAAASMPAALTYDLTSHRTAALQVELAQQPVIALAAIVHALGLKVFYDDADVDYDERADSCLEVSVTRHYKQITTAGVKGSDDMRVVREALLKSLPKKPLDFWQWCLDQTADVLHVALSFIAGACVDATYQRATSSPSIRILHSNMLAEALGLDMTQYFTADEVNYFGRIPKPMILSAIEEASGKPLAKGQEALKRGELAKLAATTVEGKGWLPEILRGPEPKQEKPVKAKPKAKAKTPAKKPAKAAPKPKGRKSAK